MKKLFAFAACIVMLLSVTSCKKLISKIFQGFDAEVPTIQFTLPAIIYVHPEEIPLVTFPQRFNLDSTIKANTEGAFGAGDVNSIKVKKIDFFISDADQNNNLSNFESVRFTLSSDAVTNPVEIASATFPDTFATNYVYTSPSSAPELKTYLNGSELRYTVYGKARRATNKPLPLTIKVTLVLK